MSDDLVRSSLAELVGTFTLVFVGGLAVASGQGVVTAALGHGLILVGIIATFGGISGAHVNPAVTLGLLVGGRIDLVKAAFYWAAQIIGALLAALLVNLLTGWVGNTGETVGSLTLSQVWLAALFEAVLTFLLVSTVYQAAVYGKAGSATPVVIGLFLAGCILAGGTYTGASLNPARTLGPALVAGHFDYLLPYMIGTFGGAALAGLLHGIYFRDQGTAVAS